MRSGYALVVDDHSLVGSGIAGHLALRGEYAAVRVAASLAECNRVLACYGEPQLAIIDFWLSDGTALALIRQFRSRNSPTPLLVISGDSDKTVENKVQEAGAQGFVLKQESPQTFALAVAALAAGNRWFSACDNRAAPGKVHLLQRELGVTHRQAEILEMMMKGYPNKRIASALFISESTVKEHIGNLFGRLGVTNRAQAITLAHQRSQPQ